jgi:hypothetical protein
VFGTKVLEERKVHISHTNTLSTSLNGFETTELTGMHQDHATHTFPDALFICNPWWKCNNSYRYSILQTSVKFSWTGVNSKIFCQQMHSLLKHKMLQVTLKISLYMAPTCFGPFRPSSGSIRRNLAKVTVFVEIIIKNTLLELLLCSGNMCFSL